jgi:hypothetical protein
MNAYMKLTAGLVAQISLFPGTAAAQHFSGWTLAVVEADVNSPFGDGCPIEAPDGLHLYLASNRPGTLGGNDIWVAARASEDAPWGEPQNLGRPVNSEASDYCPTPLHGNWLLFVSERPGEETCEAGPGKGDIYVVRRNPARGWGDPQHLGCASTGNGPNTAGSEFSPSLVETKAGTLLFFSSNAAGTQDIYVSELGDDGRFGPAAVVTELSTEFDDRMPNVGKDGLEIVFSSNRATWGGGQAAFGGQDVYAATRSSVDEPWSEPVNLGPNVNTSGQRDASVHVLGSRAPALRTRRRYLREHAAKNRWPG